jgi:predicted Rossmann fold flavoprotein
LRNVRASLYLNETCLGQGLGEMLFTHFGVSGPIILTLSKRTVESLGQGRVQIAIDFKPGLSDEQLDLRLRRDLDDLGRLTFRNLLKGLIPLRLRDVFVQLTGIPADKPGHQISAEERARLFQQLRDTRLTIIAARPLAEAIITAGGVDVKEIEPRTMASKLISGLAFCGETMDIDADTGGYNLQAAFSTGYLAGESAAAAWRTTVTQTATTEQEV